MTQAPEEPDDLTPEEIEAARAPDNAANELAIKRKRGRHKDRAQREAQAAAALLSTPSGRLLLRTIIFDICGVDMEIINAAYDPGGMHYRAGARRVGLELKALFAAANVDNFVVLLAEQLRGTA